MASERSGSPEPVAIPNERDFLRPRIQALGVEKEEERVGLQLSLTWA